LAFDWSGAIAAIFVVAAVIEFSEARGGLNDEFFLAPSRRLPDLRSNANRVYRDGEEQRADRGRAYHERDIDCRAMHVVVGADARGGARPSDAAGRPVHDRNLSPRDIA
jgi:hypothetical protein